MDNFDSSLVLKGSSQPSPFSDNKKPSSHYPNIVTYLRHPLLYVTSV